MPNYTPLAYAIIVVGFFALIAFCVYATGSAWPLWALLLTPSLRTTDTNTNKKS